MAKLDLSTLDLRYEPFPIGIARPVMDQAAYERCVASYPPLELFQFIPKVGNKYCLSEKFHGDRYADYVKNHAEWRELHAWVKSPDFIYGVMGLLRERQIDLGFERRAEGQRLRKRLKNVLKGKWWKHDEQLSARFEFSMLPADGGSVIPHTDNQDKIVTLVVSMAAPGEWDPTLGGGTEVNRHLDPSRSFNRMNGKAEFEEMERLHVYAFEPNQCVLFIKTFNSWHCVRPMTAQGSTAMRRSLTINIETRH
jgi:hypothetical protein